MLRPRLMNLLADGVTRPLTLICAPAGYGKTTLLAEWIASLDQGADNPKPKICWLSLDQNDNDPALFLSYLFSTFENISSLAENASRTVDSVSPLPPIQTVLGLLINDLVDQNDSLILVLDDYQFIEHPDIHEGLAFFIDHLPANVHVVMLTRSDPPFPLARLRVRGQLTEVRAEDLRFSVEEATCFLNQGMGLGLLAEHVAQLDERTEGWAAGLQMAALALASQPDAAKFVKNFSGSHRYILDYLIEEVLSHQPEEIQAFLLQTSLLENLTAPLCDSVTGISSGEGRRSSQVMLEYLERANLFLIPLDSERTWYRYHHLFADLLLARLEKGDPELACELHRRASRWYEHNQRYPEAIDHALTGGEVERACALIEDQVSYRVTHNGMGLLLSWIHRLPEQMARSRPWLCIAQAWSMMFTNESDQSEPLLKAAERNIPPETSIELQNEWRGHIACLWAGYYANIFDETQRTIEMAHKALTYLPPADAVSRAYAKYLLGRMYFLRGDFSQAFPILVKNSQECIQAAATNYLSHTLSAISRICRLEGRLRDAIDLLREGCAYIEACDPRKVTVAGMAFVGQVDVLREWNRLDEAEDLARRSLDLILPWKNPSSICAVYNWLVRIYLAQGKPAMAEAALNSALAAIQGRRPMAGILSDVESTQVWFWLTTGQVPKASQWARERQKINLNPKTYLICQELEEITLARVRIGEGKPDLALLLLRPLAEAAEQAGRFGRLIEIKVLQALALMAQGELKAAFDRLEIAFQWAEPEGYLRVFIDEGEPMNQLLVAYLNTPAAQYKTYAQKIRLAACFALSPALVNQPDFHPSHPADELTSRETEVLQWMVRGLSNRQIAKEIILAEGTVKFYVHSIFEKLGVHNRTQAIFEASKRNLI